MGCGDPHWEEEQERLTKIKRREMTSEDSKSEPLAPFGNQKKCSIQGEHFPQMNNGKCQPKLFEGEHFICDCLLEKIDVLEKMNETQKKRIEEGWEREKKLKTWMDKRGCYKNCSAWQDGSQKCNCGLSELLSNDSPKSQEAVGE